MNVCFLGTSSGVPTTDRNVTSVAVTRKQEIFLFDCGEGTQHQIMKSALKPSKIRRIFISHLHGDHFYGLVGLLCSLNMMNYKGTLYLYGPEGIGDYLQLCKTLSDFDFGFKLSLQEIPTLTKITLLEETLEYSIFAAPLEHRIFAIGYSIVEKAHRGKFNGALADERGIPQGAIRGKIKLGEDFVTEDGTKIQSRDFLGPPIPGEKLTICTDTVYCQSAIDLAQGSDLLIHESTYSREDEHLAKIHTHSTTHDAAKVARLANVGQLACTHFSPRYKGREQALFQGVDEIFPNYIMARDFLTIPVRKSTKEP